MDVKFSGCWLKPQHLLPTATSPCSAAHHEALAIITSINQKVQLTSAQHWGKAISHTDSLSTPAHRGRQLHSTLCKTGGSQRPDSSGFKGYKSVEGPATCRMPLLPPGPAPPILSPDIQEIQLSQLPLCLLLAQQHYLSSALQCILQHFSREKSGGECVPSPVCQHPGAVLVCQGSSMDWNTTWNSGWFFLKPFFVSTAEK